MAASPVSFPSPSLAPSDEPRRRSLALSARRLEANRRNAARSTGPRTREGKARVARNAIKHGFFAAPQRWSPAEQSDFATLLAELWEDLRPEGGLEERCVTTLAESWVRMAALLRYENIAALKEHQRREREFEQRIAAAPPEDVAELVAQRERLREAGLWRPILPGDRETAAILRCQGSLDRAIHRASSLLHQLQANRLASPSDAKSQKQTHFSTTSRSGPEASEGPALTTATHPTTSRSDFEAYEGPNPSKQSHSNSYVTDERSPEQTHLETPPTNVLRLGEGPRPAHSAEDEGAKTNPLSPMSTSNRHERRRAKALARRHRQVS